jgi:hypothetical protein
MTDPAAVLAGCLPADPANDGPVGVDSSALRALLDRVEKLESVAAQAVTVLRTAHEDFRENIDFNPLWDVLVAAGLYEPDDAPDGGE